MEIIKTFKLIQAHQIHQQAMLYQLHVQRLKEQELLIGNFRAKKSAIYYFSLNL